MKEPSEDGSFILGGVPNLNAKAFLSRKLGFEITRERERAAASAASIRSKAENCHRRNSLPPLNDEMVRATLCVAKPK